MSSSTIPTSGFLRQEMNITIHETIQTEFLKDLFHLPLSQEAYAEFQNLETLCGTTSERINPREIDNWSYIWNS
jgi:hypothetical protein